MTSRVRNIILSAFAACLMSSGGCALHEDIDQISYEPGADVSPNNVNNANNVEDMPGEVDMPGDMDVVDLPGPFDLGDMTEVEDMTDMGVADMSTDAGTDMGEADMAEADMPPDMAGNFGSTCPGVDTTALGGNCDVVNDTTCPTGFACSVVLVSGPPDVEFGTGCIQIDQPEPWTQTTGEECNPERCVAGHQCVGNVCRKYCRLADAEGCEVDEFCEQINEDTSEFGVCLTACTP